MNESDKLIKNTKKKFLIYSLVGIGLVAIVSYSALNLHVENVNRQESIQKMYSMITKQLRLVGQISILSEKFDDSEINSVSSEINKEFKALLKDLVLLCDVQLYQLKLHLKVVL